MLSLVFLGCREYSSIKSGASNDLEPQSSYQIVEIDSCEYIYLTRRPWGSEMAIAHKGNCKYCEERRKNEVH